ncbi:MAG: hypothetical protein AAAB11_08920 [Rhizobium giardinii]
MPQSLSAVKALREGNNFAADNAPYAGIWDCEVSTFTFTKDTYDSGEGPMPIQKVEKEEGNYILSFSDGYQIGLSSVTDTTMQWFSMQTGDQFECKRVK